VFVSYSAKDRWEALAVKRILDAEGCQVRLAGHDAVPGRQRQPALSGADLLCPLLSPTAVASPWLGAELRLARERNLPVLPVILRPCDLPAGLGEPLSAVDGVAAEHVRLRLVRAVLGPDAVPDTVIDAAFRAAAADHVADNAAAVPALRELATQFARVRRVPIRRLSIELDAGALPPDGSVVLELVFAVDGFTSPLSFFFAPFREGRTWPPELGFTEPPYTDFALGQARVDAKLRWYDRVVTLQQTPDPGDGPASFSAEFDGSDWQPPGVPLSRAYEIPCLDELTAAGASFRLAAHFPQTRRAVWLDPAKTDFDILVSTALPTANPARPRHCRLFASRHDGLETALCQGDFLAALPTDLDRELLLGAYPPLVSAHRELHEERTAEAERIYESGDVRDDADRRSSARLAWQEASLHRLRGRPDLAGPCLERAATLLEAIPLPTRPDAHLLINIYGRLLEIARTWQRPVQFWACNDRMLALSSTMASVDDRDPDYRRWFARALEDRARGLVAENRLTEAATTLREAVTVLRDLHTWLNTPTSRADLATTLHYAADYARSHRLPVPSDDWSREAEKLAAN
jgi:hypothetical protein